MNLLYRIANWALGSKKDTPNTFVSPGETSHKNKPNIPPDRPGQKPGALPSGRVSVPTSTTPYTLLNNFSKEYRVVDRLFLKEVIPVIRKLMMMNPDISQAVHNIVSLGNTGHKILFDRSVPTELVDKMRNHLKNKHKEWASGSANMDGLVNKMFSQVLVSGALSNEWVPNKDLTGVESVIMVNPEEICFILDSTKSHYLPYQEPRTILPGYNSKNNVNNLIKLNTRTYKYYALNGDTEIPYGFPPYLAALPGIHTQQVMNNNINFVVNQLGIMGFLEVLIEKPDQESGKENDETYEARLDALLTTAKKRVESGYSEGSIVGFKNDHEFKFNSIARDFDKVIELYKNNELQIASATKQDASLWGRDYNTSETQITVVFMKMLSELRNIQNLIKTNLEFGYSFELRLAGFKFDYLQVQFNHSTIQDDLKYQQAEETKLRNILTKLFLGIIDIEQASDELGYEAPAFKTPPVPLIVLAGKQSPIDESKKAQDREASKDKTERDKKQKDKPMPKDKKS